jgi:prepilin-type N-terminal cleavage/methylation domain-containing protein
MNGIYYRKNGFTLVEILVALTILVILMSIGAYALINTRTAKQLDTTTDSIAAKLEEARTNALSGKSGTNFGLAFSSTTYTYWSGASYTAGTASTITYTIPTGFSLTSTIPGTDHILMFSRITGIASATGNITITHLAQPTFTDTISVGTRGDISVIK